ncbi:hypothetical protein [Sulfurovum mangrovi]|uniref:hypothetical protein n=1 Tax=Sulfurovum mangrovi TaxID=2893889 RepID=UPI001E62FDB3|nr:hypothetical protein [Sulfurovum mangrovi]UFH58241.1 hypothetical protein LN246_07730 [Sulfurovum mangrovi]
MKEYFGAYYQAKEQVIGFIEDSVLNVGTVSAFEEENFANLFDVFKALELVYVVDAKSSVQTSPNIYPNRIDKDAKDISRAYLLDRLEIKENGFAFTAPYKSAATQTLCITVTKKEGDKIIFMDFDLKRLLERLKLIERHAAFDAVQLSFYLFTGAFMAIIALAAVLYSLFDFGGNVMAMNLDIHTIFKPIIAATLGLAIFDLAKTVLEQEVFYKSYVKNSKEEVKLLTKFLFTILIALAIETLMVVFKIAMKEDGEMVNALYLMGGISFIILSLAVFIYLTQRKNA